MDKGLSRKNVTRVGPELWWTRLQELAKSPEFDELMDVELRRARITN